jgi:hypothetical protein
VVVFSSVEIQNRRKLPKNVGKNKVACNFAKKSSIYRCVGDPDLHPDPYVFGPLRSASGSVSHKYGSGSGSFHHQAKEVRKNLEFCCFVTSL